MKWPRGVSLTGFYNLKLGDRLIRPKGLIKHHAIYVGVRNGIPYIAENQKGRGVQIIPYSQFLNEGPGPVTVVPFNGTENARKQIIPRIKGLIGSNYDLINFNCEHFAEFIQNGKALSNQVGAAAFGAVVLLVLGALQIE